MHIKNLTRALVISVSLFITSCIKMDDSMKVFFPKELSNLHKIQTDFPVFWWNFVLIENKEQNFKQVEEICANLKKHLKNEFNLVMCRGEDQIPFDLLKSWSQDVFLREAFDKKKIGLYLEAMNGTMNFAVFSQQKEFLNFLRFDPLQSWRVYEKKMSEQSLPTLSLENGYFRIKGTSMIAIPVQFSGKPSQKLVKPIVDLLDTYKDEVFLMGVHGSAYRNEFQVKADLEIISIVTAVVFILFLLYLVFKAGYSVLLLSIPVTISVFIAAQIVVLIYGSVHGLTLSFGSGVIGLALDYGLHGLLGKSLHRTWYSNFVGMLTTLCGVLILVCSGIPLIRQMMLFSTIGLLIAFLIYYLLFKYFSKYFNTKSFKICLPYFKYSQFLVLLIALFGLIGFKNVQMNLDLKKMNLMSDREVNYSKILFSQKGKFNETYMVISNKNNFFQKDYFHKALVQNISYQGLDTFIPNEADRLSNFNSWQRQGCKELQLNMSLEQKKFFEPYFSAHCGLHDSSSLNLTDKFYLKPFTTENEVLSLFYPQTENQVLYLEKNIPEAKSIAKSVMSFSEVLQKELKWMIPVSLLLTFIILYLYYRRFELVLCSVFPFFVGMSLFFLMSAILNIEIDLIAVLGLVMVFGFSIDYGVFSTDSYHYQFDNNESDNVYTALSLASITNLLGFLPMIFAVHPVLKQFGYALFFGTLGAYLGTIYGLKYYFRIKNLKRENLT